MLASARGASGTSPHLQMRMPLCPVDVGRGALTPLRRHGGMPPYMSTCNIVKQLLCPNRQTVLFIQMETVKKLRVIVGDGAAAPLVIQ